MTSRRQFLAGAGAIATSAWLPTARAQQRLPSRPIPGTDEVLPIIGLGNSNAFRQGDMPTSTALIELFQERGGRYIDCMGSSRFVVAEACSALGVSAEMFLGTYFMEGDETQMRADARRLLEITGKSQLDLVHAYPDFAVPNWDMLRQWKDEGLTRFIGVSRHNRRYYDDMMTLMETGTVDFLQVNYSPLETESAQRILPMAMDKGVAVNINRPFINGDYFSLVRGHELPEWAAEFDCNSWAQFALKFILSHPAVTCVLTETANPDHALDNIGAGFGRMPDQDQRRRIVEHLRSL